MRWRIPLIRLAIVLLVFGGIFMGYKSWDEHKRNAKIQAEIDALEREAEKIRRENETLAQKIEYFASPDFQEQEAKKKLGLKRQEETVVALREVATLPTEQPIESPVVSDHLDMGSTPNFQKWWKLFFW